MPVDEAVDAARHAANQDRMAEMEQRIGRMEEGYEKLAGDVHTMKGNLAANTSFSRESLKNKSNDLQSKTIRAVFSYVAYYSSTCTVVQTND